MLRVGVLKELKNDDGRVGLCPNGVKELVASGVEVFVEIGSGEGSTFSDEKYVEAGAVLVPSAEKLAKNAQIIIKVLPITPAELDLFDASHIIFSFLKLGNTGKRLSALSKSKVIYFGAELIENSDGQHPVLEAMSAVSGRMAVHVAANLLSSSHGGKGILLSGADLIPPANITIIGSGLVGRIAAMQAWSNGANVRLLSLKPEKISSYNLNRDGLTLEAFSMDRLKELLPATDILIVSVYSLSGLEMALHIDKDTLSLLAPGSVVIDLSVEQSPIVETSHVTNINQPTYTVNDIIHYCVPTIAAAVPKTSSEIFTNKILEYIKVLALNDLKIALNKSPELLSGLALYKGKITNRTVADRYDHTFQNIFDLLEMSL